MNNLYADGVLVVIKESVDSISLKTEHFFFLCHFKMFILFSDENFNEFVCIKAKWRKLHWSWLRFVERIQKKKKCDCDKIQLWCEKKKLSRKCKKGFVDDENENRREHRSSGHTINSEQLYACVCVCVSIFKTEFTLFDCLPWSSCVDDAVCDVAVERWFSISFAVCLFTCLLFFLSWFCSGCW